MAFNKTLVNVPTGLGRFQRPTILALASQRIIMDQIINDISRAYIKAIPQSRFNCEMTFFGHSMMGSYTYGLFGRNKIDLGDIRLEGDDQFLIHDLMDEIKDTKDSRKLPPYKFNLSFNHKGKFNYEVLYPNLDFSNLVDVPKDPSGYYPDYVYINLTEKLISQLDDFSINQMIPQHIEWARTVLGFESDVEYSKSISEEFYLQMLNINIQSEIENGTFDQLYSNFSEYPAYIISDLYQSFYILNNIEVLQLIKESIQLYSHFHENVNEARKNLGLDSVEKKTESDIMDRYYKISPELDDLRAEYIRSNPTKFCNELIKS
jgi:hypothetical protein